MTNVQGLRWLHVSFVTVSIQLVLLPACRSPWQTFPSCGVLSISESLTESSPHFAAARSQFGCETPPFGDSRDPKRKRHPLEVPS